MATVKRKVRARALFLVLFFTISMTIFASVPSFAQSMTTESGNTSALHSTTAAASSDQSAAFAGSCASEVHVAQATESGNTSALHSTTAAASSDQSAAFAGSCASEVHVARATESGNTSVLHSGAAEAVTAATTSADQSAASAGTQQSVSMKAAGAVAPIAATPFDVILSYTGDTSTTMTVSWRDYSRNDEVLQVAAETAYDKTGFTGAAAFKAAVKDISLDASGVWHYEATADGLSPATVYKYRITAASGASTEPASFTTSDPSSRSLTFAYMGDIQTVKDSAAEYATWGKLASSMYALNPDIAFTMLGGDIVESGIDTKLFDQFLENASPVFSHIPLMATNGNHESNFPDSGKPELYTSEFAFPQNGPDGFKEEFYSYDVANCHVLVLNSWIFSGEQKLTDADYARVNSWIENDLATSDADWQVVVTHVPVYAVASDTTSTAVRKNWAPIFEKYGVDLVFEGHQHVYSRSYPLTEGKVDYNDGITYIMGVSGSKFYTSADETLAEKTIYSKSTYQLAQIDGQAMTVRTLDTDGNELDYVSLAPRKVSLTRSEYIRTLWNAAGAPAAKAASPFTDDSSQAAAWAYESGLVTGYGGGLFGPDDQITTQQQSIIISRKKAA